MAASLKGIRKQISSIKSTLKITKAMKMVAGARLNRAQQRIVSLRPYAVKTQEILQSVADSLRQSGEDASASRDLHPLLAERPEKKVLFLIMTGDRGLCGGFNTSISKATFLAWKAKETSGETNVTFATAGRKGREYLQRRGAEVVRDFPRMYDGLDQQKSKQISAWVVNAFEKGEVDAVYLAYNEFKSAIAQKVTIEPLLPLPKVSAEEQAKNASTKAEFIFEPNPRALLERLVPLYVEISVYRALLETQAGFFGAQMTAMDAATRNAKDAIDRYTLLYNRARQAAITKELMEIIGGAEALKE
ncbi:MAG: ATP synthase F1 subunit gamma [Polyangiaceae bacterium]